MQSKVINISVLLVMMAGTVYFLLRDQELDQLFNSIKSIDKLWFVGGIFCIMGFVCFESVILKYLLNCLNHSINILHCIKYSFIGFFVSAITPSSTGGQPAQVYFMKQDGIPVSISTLIIMVVTFTFKLALILIAGIMLVFEYDFLMDHVKGIEFIIIYGMGVNVVVTVALALVIFRQSLAKRLVGNFVLFMGKHKIIKNHDVKLKKILKSIEKYEHGAIFLRRNKLVVFNVMVITVIQRLLYFAVTYAVYRAFGLKGCSPFEIIILQLIITMAVDNLPWPGGMGVNEGIFLVFFTEIFTQSFVTAGLLVTRGINYYFIILVGGIISALARFMRRKVYTKQKKIGNGS